ncbi:MAG TPA: hypothetical protein VLT47_02230 [Anaeromyxobacteraceae bacterium]|nr:hypothetical protein [Anaeromyxobacteraceae bacterium]
MGEDVREKDGSETAEELPRLGSYFIRQAGGTNALGATLSGAALAGWWRELIEYCVGARARRREAAKDVDAAWSKGEDASSILQWRYGQKIEIKSAEAVADLLHGIIAPDAPFLCDDRCNHVRAGAGAPQVKRFLDSIDVEIARLRKRWRDCPYDHPCYEDLQDEFGIYEKWRGRLVELAQATPGVRHER